MAMTTVPHRPPSPFRSRTEARDRSADPATLNEIAEELRQLREDLKSVVELISPAQFASPAPAPEPEPGAVASHSTYSASDVTIARLTPPPPPALLPRPPRVPESVGPKAREAVWEDTVKQQYTPVR